MAKILDLRPHCFNCLEPRYVGGGNSNIVCVVSNNHLPTYKLIPADMTTSKVDETKKGVKGYPHKYLPGRKGAATQLTMTVVAIGCLTSFQVRSVLTYPSIMEASIPCKGGVSTRCPDCTESTEYGGGSLLPPQHVLLKIPLEVWNGQAPKFVAHFGTKQGETPRPDSLFSHGVSPATPISSSTPEQRSADAILVPPKPPTAVTTAPPALPARPLPALPTYADPNYCWV